MARVKNFMSQYIIYCRKSSESEERQVLSIEAQLKELQELAKRHHYAVSEILTESKSAKQPGRPVFNDLMKRVHKGQVKGIIVWKLDRLARNPVDGGALVWALNEDKISEIVTAHGTFSNDSSAKFMMQMEFGIAKKYVDDLSDNVKRGNRTKLEKGWYPGLAPLGYLNELRDKTIVKDPERFPLIRKMWELLLQGVKPAKILDVANDEWGFRTRMHKRIGGKPLSLSGLYKIFGSPFYYGLIERKEGVFIGRHEPLISEEEYLQAQNILGRPGRDRSKTHTFAFTGIIRCGECDCMITAEEKDNRYGYHYAYYRCTKKKKNQPCSQKYINVNDLERQILEYLKKIQVNDRLLYLAIDYLKKEKEEQETNYLNIHTALKKAQSDCEKKLGNLNQMRLRELIGDDEYLKEKKALLSEKMKLENSLRNGNTGQDVFALTVGAFSFANHVVEHFQNGTMEEKRQVLQKIGSNLMLKDKKLLIQAKKVFHIIEDGIKGVVSEMRPLEPLNNGLFELKFEPSLTQIQSWHAVVDNVRTFYEKEEKSGN
jgi:DNA invertase Pin-like site-specific DNA recombinase